MRHFGIVTAAVVVLTALNVVAGSATRRVVLRVQSDDKQDSTAFKDTSPLAQKVLPAGNVHHSTAHRKTGGSSIRFTGGDDHLAIPDGPAFSFGTDDFSVECWIKPEGAGRRFVCGQAPRDGANIRSSIGMAIEADGRLRASAQSTERTYLLYAPEKAYADGEWHHVSFRRVEDQLYLVVDGQTHDRADIGAEALNDADQPFAIGRAGAFPTDPYRGHIDDFTISRQPRHITDF